MVFDIVIENGLLVDGTGAAGRRADVGISKARIAAIGDLAASAAGRRLDATGSVVAPGFVDIHTHSELPLLADGRAESTIRQGVTTQATGNCGLTPAPVRDAVREQIKGTMIGPAHGSWRWTTFGEFLGELKAAPKATHVAPLVGHGAIRACAVGFANRKPTPAELPAGGWLQIELIGTSSNRSGVGAVLTIDLGQQRLVRTRQAGTGYCSCGEERLLIGVGDAALVKIVSIRWPSGRQESWNDLPVHAFRQWVEGTGHRSPLAPREDGFSSRGARCLRCYGSLHAVPSMRSSRVMPISAKPLRDAVGGGEVLLLARLGTQLDEQVQQLAGQFRFFARRDLRRFSEHAQDVSTTQVYTHLDFQHLARIYDASHPRARRKRP